MEDKGYIFTIDAILSLLILFIFISAICNIKMPVFYESNADEILSTMANCPSPYNSTLEKVCFYLDSNDKENAKKVCECFFRKNFPGLSYKLIVDNGSEVLASSGTLNDTDSAIRNFGSHTFYLLLNA